MLFGLHLTLTFQVEMFFMHAALVVHGKHDAVAIS